MSVARTGTPTKPLSFRTVRSGAKRAARTVRNLLSLAYRKQQIPRRIKLGFGMTKLLRFVLRQIEQQDFSVFRGFDGQLLLVADGRSVALIEFTAVQFDRSARDLQPTVATCVELVTDFFSGLQQ